MKGYHHASDQEIQSILESYQRTKSTVLTAQELGLPPRRVTGLLKRRGIELTKAHGGACYQHQDNVIAWAQQGISLSEIARRIGTKHQLVKKFLVDHDIDYIPFEQKMQNNPAWKGGRMVDEDGYILVKSPDHPYKDRHGYVREHRLVVEAKIGRYLDPQEVVHHRDNDRQNNHVDNLELFGSNAMHLAETLRGKTPQWSDEGVKRIQEGVNRSATKRRSATRPVSEIDGCQ